MRSHSMRYKSIFLCLIVCCLNLNAKYSNNHSILKDKLETSNVRYRTFLAAMNLLNRKFSPIIVETGTARYGRKNCADDGCSTIIFAEWLKRHQGEFYSVDIDPVCIENAREGLEELNPYVSLVCADSVSFLKGFNKTIDFLYLDSYDFEFDNPNPSQEHHLKEIMAAYPHLADDCIVMIDDCALPHGGKGKLAIDFLLTQGWRLLAQSYQVILTRN